MELVLSAVLDMWPGVKLDRLILGWPSERGTSQRLEANTKAGRISADGALNMTASASCFCCLGGVLA